MWLGLYKGVRVKLTSNVCTNHGTFWVEQLGMCLAGPFVWVRYQP